jgi:hypothetical protein
MSMGRHMCPEDKELYQRADEVLHYVWDPIGVANAPMARDEYHGYLPQVFRLTKENETPEAIAAYLEEVATKRMGFNPNQKQALEVAALLLEWKEVISEKYSAGESAAKS